MRGQVDKTGTKQLCEKPEKLTPLVVVLFLLSVIVVAVVTVVVFL